MYTKQGRPLQEMNGFVYSRSGAVVGRREGDKVFGQDGRYVGTVDGDRLVHRLTDTASISGPFAMGGTAGTAVANAAGSAIWGDEPKIPD